MPKSISRKIWVVEKSSNFHIVQSSKSGKAKWYCLFVDDLPEGKSFANSVDSKKKTLLNSVTLISRKKLREKNL